MIEPARFDALLRLFLRFSNDRVKELPVAPEVLLKDTGAELLTLSELTRSPHCGTQDIFGIWGNRDGAVFASEGVFSVCYNESMPRRRVRFTLAEELMHIVLGHVGSGEFLNKASAVKCIPVMRRRQSFSRGCCYARRPSSGDTVPFSMPV